MGVRESVPHTVSGAVDATRVVVAFLEGEIFPVVKARSSNDEWETCLRGYFHRLFGNLRGLSQLFQPSFFQLTQCAMRNSFEILVDVVHLVHREPADAVERILAWENGQLLNWAKVRNITAYVEAYGGGDEAAWHQFWPKRLPNRWTGKTLLDACRSADQLEPDLGLEATYDRMLRPANWHLHGSAFAGIRGLSVGGIDLVFSASHIVACDLGVIAVGRCLKGLALQTESLEARLAQVQAELWRAGRRSFVGEDL
jgi:hypothetical protein